MKAVDTTALSVLLVPGCSICRKGTSVPIKHAKERLAWMIERSREPVVIPTPVSSELLVMIPPDKVTDLVDALNSSSWFRVESFDAASAIELASRIAASRAAGDKREGLPAETPWTKVKFDRQIVAVAITSGATEIISEDPDVKAIGDRWGVKVISVDDLETPPELIPPPLLAGLEGESEPDHTKAPASEMPATIPRIVTGIGSPKDDSE